MFTAKQLREILSEQIVNVTFKKKDGTVRNMLCTLMPFFLPTPVNEVCQDGRIDNVITCWDLEKSDWRAFRVDSIIEVEYDEDTTGNREIENPTNG